jgi:hypothetical protein
LEAGMKKLKKLWRCCFNYSQSPYIFYRQAFTERQAWLLGCQILAKKHQVPLSYVTGLFDGSRDNYTVQIETDFKEVDA